MPPRHPMQRISSSSSIGGRHISYQPCPTHIKLTSSWHLTLVSAQCAFASADRAESPARGASICSITLCQRQRSKLRFGESRVSMKRLIFSEFPQSKKSTQASPHAPLPNFKRVEGTFAEALWSKKVDEPFLAQSGRCGCQEYPDRIIVGLGAVQRLPQHHGEPIAPGIPKMETVSPIAWVRQHNSLLNQFLLDGCELRSPHLPRSHFLPRDSIGILSPSA